MFEQFEIENSFIIGNRNSMEMKVEGMISNIFTSEWRNNNMRLIEMILGDENLNEAVKRIKSNKGVAGVDKMTVYEIDTYFQNNKERIKKEILEKKYRPQPVKRVYIPKSNGKKRPLGIPTVMDRVIQQATAQVLMKIYEDRFSDNSFGFRPNRSAHDAVERTLDYLNEGCEWVIDMDIEAYFDTVNHDKLISILREEVKNSTTLHLIRKFLQAGIMEKGLVKPNTIGMPQGGPLSPILSNIYLDKFDKELESRGLRFVRYADDSNIFVKSEMSANRVMKSVISWLERKLFLKVSATKTKVVRPMKMFIDKFGQWLRHKVRVIIIKQWKKPDKIERSLQLLNRKLPYKFSEEQIYSVANSRLGWYKQANGNVVNFLLNADILAINKRERPGLVNPLEYYLR